MTATFAELMFSAAFMVFIDAGLVFALLPERESLRLGRAISQVAGRIAVRSFPLNEGGQATSQPEPVVPACSQPVVSIAS